MSGTYNYRFTKLEPFYNNADKTGISSLVVGMICNFSGVFENSQLTAYIEGTTGFGVCCTPEYLTDNISGIANEYASGQCWCHNLSGQIDGPIEIPVRYADFPYPADGFPPVNPYDM
jgi:hypothetical protein